MSDQDLWHLIHAERAALAEVLRELSPGSWQSPTLCEAWTVQNVVAHLTAAARTSTLPWLANMVASRLDTDRHNQRLLEKHQGSSPAETLERFRTAVPTTNVPLNSREGALGEVVVHSQDIVRPLGISLMPSREAMDAVATFFARTDFAVSSKTLVTGLHLEATEGPFRAGDGPKVTGGTLDLVMAMAGRRSAVDELTGDGVNTLRSRLTSP